MHKLLLPVLALLAAMTLPDTRPAEPPAATQPLRVMSFNIRFDNPNDGEHAWPHRRRMVAEIIRFYDVDLVGAQEALEHQVNEVAEDTGLKWVGGGRADGMVTGEFSPIFYRDTRFELLESGIFWLSEKPDEPGSKGWDAALPRIVTWARLRDKAAARDLLVMNTHFDHAGAGARAESAKLLVKRAREMAGEMPLVIMGDFNGTPDSPEYATLAENFTDAREASATGHFGPDETFGTFQPTTRPAVRIDYIFLSGHWEVLREGTLSHHWHGRHASDHWPIFAELRWR